MTEEMNVNITGNFLISQDTFKTRVDRTAKSALVSGKHVSLSCLIEALGKPSTVKQFIWSRNGEDIMGKSHSSQLNITVSNVECSIRNYANPVYGFATICHQVRCLRWGHPSLIYTATSLLIRYKMFYMRDISYRLISVDEIYKHALVCVFWDAQAFYLMNCCGFNIEPFCSDVCGDHRRPQTLAEICRNMGICCGFRAAAARENIRGSSYYRNIKILYVILAKHHFYSMALAENTARCIFRISRKT